MSSHVNRTAWLEKMNLGQVKACYWQLSVPELVEHALGNKEGVLSTEGALVCSTGRLTGRSPQDKFIVSDETTQDTIWWGMINTPFTTKAYDALYSKMVTFLKDKRIYVRDSYVNAVPTYRLSLRIVTTQAWHSLFANNLFLRPDTTGLSKFIPDFVIIQVPEFQAEPSKGGTKNANFTVINFTKKIILIGGTGYAGEMKKAVFTVLNYLLPLQHQILPMHCAANMNQQGDVAIYFGLSGTGKTTLSADPTRKLIGDDEHGWYDEGVFNFEGGCYAKVINLSESSEPQIFHAIKFGTLIENMRFELGTRKLNYRDASITENMRSAYPIHYVDGALSPSIGGIPKHIFFLTCDAYGVLPPIAKLDKNQIIYYFLLGYTAKVAGTETGIKTPKAIFSTCFGAPFLPLHPSRYADLLAKRLEQHEATVWLLNTGWVGGGYGVGDRIALAYTRAMVRAALTGALDQVGFVKDAVFQLSIPKSCPDVPTNLLTPDKNWQDPQEYAVEARKLFVAFENNFNLYTTGVL